jgi:putative transposase
MDYRYGSHTVYQIEYHFVWVTKYRYKVLSGEVAERVRELVRQTCEAFEIRIVKGVVSKDHVHILVSSPPNLAPSEIMRRIKGAYGEQTFRGVSPPEEAVLGPAFLGAGVFLRDGWADDGGDDQAVSGASFRAEPERRFQDGAGLIRRVVQSTRIRTFSP